MGKVTLAVRAPVRSCGAGAAEHTESLILSAVARVEGAGSAGDGRRGEPGDGSRDASRDAGRAAGLHNRQNEGTGETEVCPGSVCRGREARRTMFGGRLVINSLSPINVKIVFGFRRRD